MIARRKAFLTLTATGTVVVGGGLTALALQTETPVSGQAINAEGDIELIEKRASPPGGAGEIGVPATVASV